MFRNNFPTFAKWLGTIWLLSRVVSVIVLAGLPLLFFFIYPLLPFYGWWIIPYGIFALVFWLTFYKKVFPRLYSPKFTCPLCGGMVTLFFKHVSTLRQDQYAKCEKCGEHARTGGVIDSEPDLFY